MRVLSADALVWRGQPSQKAEKSSEIILKGNPMQTESCEGQARKISFQWDRDNFSAVIFIANK